MRTLLLSILALTTSSFAFGARCDRGEYENLALNNRQVLHFKTHTAEAFQAEVHVSGVFLRAYDLLHMDKRFQIQIGPRAGDTVEIYYRGDRPLPPHLKRGDQIEACGRYRTSLKDTIYQKASPDGAYIFQTYNDWQAWPGAWDGFLIINGQEYR